MRKERRKAMEEKKKRIAKDPKRCLGDVLLEISEVESKLEKGKNEENAAK